MTYTEETIPKVPDDCTVLIIDDDQGICDAYKKVIAASSKARVLCATNGQDGLDLAIEHQPDLILLDLVMPETDGFEVLTEIKKNSETSSIPIVILTGNTNPDNLSKSLYLYAEAFLTKSCSVKEVLSTICATLSRHGCRT
jgi:DNA-binding response OmpR family regulator